MKLLLYCDEYCYKYNGSYYLEEFGIILLNRYLKVYDSIKYPVRVKEVQKFEQLGAFNKIIDSTKVEVIEIPYGIGMSEFVMNYCKIQSAINNIEKDCSLAILRMPSIYSFCIWHKIKRTKLPYAVEVVFDCYDGYKSSDSIIGKIAWLLMHSWQKEACSKAIGVSCVTAQYLQKRYFPNKPDAIKSNYSSIELPSSYYYKERKFPTDGPLKIIHVAYQVAFNSRKGHNQLIQALKLLRDEGINAELIFVGGDYDNGFLKLSEFAKKLGVQNEISFTGFISRAEVINKMKEATVAVLPTKAEGLPRVVIEAMASGLPCISTNVSGNPELLEDKYLLDYTDVDGLANAIKLLMKDPKEYERTSRLNFEKSKCYESSYLDKVRTDFYRKIGEKAILFDKQ